MTDNLPCWHINLNYYRAASLNLVAELHDADCLGIFIPDSRVNTNKIKGLPSDWNVNWDTFYNVPRTWITTSPNTPGTLLSQFTSQDSSAILIESHRMNEQSNVFATFYKAYNEPVPPLLHAELSAFCQDGNLSLVIGCDSNAHHTSRGSSYSNRRGHDLSEFLASCQIDWCYVGITKFSSCQQEGGAGPEPD